MSLYAMDVDLRARGMGHYQEPWATRERLRLAARERGRKSSGDADDAILARAFAVLANGKPYIAHFSSEGSAESGPMGWVEVGYRWGQMRLSLGQDGSVAMWRQSSDGWVRDWATVHNSSGYPTGASYVGMTAMIKDHLNELKSNIMRNGVEFARTGKCPAPSIDEQECMALNDYERVRRVRGHGINE